jgi:hypothetical protein
MSENYLAFSDGLPTKPDVDLLLKKWPQPKVGDTFGYDEIAAELGIAPRSRRFWTVVRRWRERCRDELSAPIHVDSESQFFFVPNIDQSNARTYVVIRSVQRKARRQRSELRTFIGKQELNDMQRSMLEHNMTRMAIIEREAKKQKMNALPATAVQEPPKLSPPRQRKTS